MCFAEMFLISLKITKNIKILNIVRIFPFRKAVPVNSVIPINRYFIFLVWIYFKKLNNIQGINAIAKISGL
jgi:hypothetical protein